jgi:hypothetical protein
MIVVTRKTLLESRMSFANFGAINLLSVQPEYRTDVWSEYDTIKAAMEREQLAVGAHHRGLIMKMGNQFTDEKGLEQYAVSPAREDEFQMLMSSYLDTPVEIEVDMIPTGIFGADGPALSVGDRAALKWLLVERGPHND